MLRNAFNRDHIVLMVIFILAFLLYGNTIPNGYSLDDTYVTQNNIKVQKGFAGIPEIFTSRYVDEEGNAFGYRPVAMATFAIEYGLWGQNPHLSHFINVVLYALILVLLYRILRKIFNKIHILYLLAVVLLFAAHPIHTEVVASLKNRETLLSFLFSLAALSFFLKWMDNRQKWFVITGVFFFILAFLSKQDSVTFAAVIPLTMFYYSSEPVTFSKTFNWHRHLFKSPDRYLSLAIISFLFFYLTTWGLGAVPALLSFFSTLAFLILYYWKCKNEKGLDKVKKLSYLFLISGVMLITVAIYFLNPGFALLSLICFAVYFTRVLEKVKIRHISIPSIWFVLLMPMFLLGIAGVLFHQLPDFYLPAEEKVVYHFENPQFVNDPGYSTFPLALYTIFFYLQKLIWPHPLGFYYGYKMIPVVSWTSPEVIFSLVFYTGIFIFALTRMRQKHVLSFAILFYLITISIFTNIFIKIPGIVGERLAFFPSLGFCLALAWVIFRVLKIDIQLPQIQRIKVLQLSLLLVLFLVPYSIKTIVRNAQWKDYLTLFSHDVGYLENSAKANNVYANQLLKEAYNNDENNPAPAIQKEYLDLSVQHLKKTVEIDPTYKFAWNNLGFVTYRYLDKKEEGMDYMNRALQLDQGYEEAHFNLGYAYKQQGNFEQSIQHFHDAQRINPGKLLYYTEEADAWFQSGNREKAMTVYKKATELDSTSDQPLIGMGNIYWLSGDTVRAIENWEKAFKINPTNLEICKNLLGYYTSKGNTKATYYKTKIRELMQKSP